MHGQWFGNDAPQAGSWHRRPDQDGAKGDQDGAKADQEAAKDEDGAKADQEAAKDEDGAKDAQEGAKDDHDAKSLAIIEAHKAGHFDLKSPLGCLFRREMRKDAGFKAC